MTLRLLTWQGWPARYARWLHLRWPAGTVEKLPEVSPDGTTRVPGVYVVGDLSGVPLLKFSSDGGARAVAHIVGDRAFSRRVAGDGVLDLLIIGAGVSGMAAALEARKQQLRFQVIEASEAFSTVINFPAGKPIFTYPHEMTPAGSLQFRREVHPKEQLLEDLRRQCSGIEPEAARAERIEAKDRALWVHVVRPDGEAGVIKASRVIVAIGRSGNFRRLNVPGEDLDKVFNRLHDPKDYAEQECLVVGGGDSALETAIALAESGARVTLSYRGNEFSRAKPENVDRLNRLLADPRADVQVERPSSPRVTTAAGDFIPPPRRPGSIKCLMPSTVKEILAGEVVIRHQGTDLTLPNDAVFPMIGRQPPLEFFRRSGIPISGEFGRSAVVLMFSFVLLCFWLYHWKSGHAVPLVGSLPHWLDINPSAVASLFTDRSTLLGTIAQSAGGRSFYYTLAYSLIVVIFGIRRIRRRRTPYVKWQTLTLMAIQVVPLFILPEIILPWLGHNGVFDSGFGAWLKNTFFPNESWWRAYGLVLAWPLFVYNWFTDAPIWGWLILGAIQTFGIIPAMVYFWGKGAYCGWICSCGALAETLGDTQRHKMPHGPAWNRLNLAGQVILLMAALLMLLRILGWILGRESWAARVFHLGFDAPLGYAWTVDLILAGVIGYGLYFWFSGRVWCRFFCPLAALMHIYARFSRFRIIPDKKKCISCNVCTSVCHQGIDVMNFANKGLAMADPECVRCSACVQMCPTGVLSFGQVDRRTGKALKLDPPWLAASPVILREIGVNGKQVQV